MRYLKALQKHKQFQNSIAIPMQTMVLWWATSLQPTSKSCQGNNIKLKLNPISLKTNKPHAPPFIPDTGKSLCCCHCSYQMCLSQGKGRIPKGSLWGPPCVLLPVPYQILPSDYLPPGPTAKCQKDLWASSQGQNLAVIMKKLPISVR